jgi:DNA-binding NarL/FixJ family response regulator
MSASHIRPAGSTCASVIDNGLRTGVLLVDNRDIIHLGLRVLLARQEWVTRVVSAKRGADAVLLAERHRPRVAVIDLFVGSEYGVNICRAVRERSPDTRVLLTSSSTVLTQHAARLAGATGFIAKDTAATEMLAAIRAVAQSNPRFVWRPEVSRGPLSRRQQQILNLMAEGATNPHIAELLGLSLDTVKHHTTLIYKRLQVPNRAAAVHLAQRLGLLSPAPPAEQQRPRPPLQEAA